MTENVKSDLKKKVKPPTQIAGVTGIDAHKPMGSDSAPYIDWSKLVNLPAFEMFVLEESGQSVGANATEWVANRRNTMGDDKLYSLYAKWHETKGCWPNESPTGELIEG